MSRERRRRDKARMKKRARQAYPQYPGAEKLADHIKNCSCAACCNRRQLEGPTRQELLKDDLEDFNASV